MDPVVANRLEEVEGLCKRFGVRRLELFGSAASGSFDPERSDLDFLVEFSDEPGEGLSKRYFGLLFGLEALFARKIDLLMPRAVRNPVFLEAVEESRILLYAA